MIARGWVLGVVIVVCAGLLGVACATKSAPRRGPGDDLLTPSRGGGGGGGGALEVADEAPEASLPQPVARWSELTKQLGQELRRVGTSCALVAKAMRTFVDAHGKEYGQLQQEVMRWEKRTVRKEVDRFYRRVFPELNTRIDAGIRCKDDAAARAAYDAFFRTAGLDTR